MTIEFLDFDEDIMVPQEVAVEFGGNFNILESIWIGGIGSPPVFYRKGIEFFDEYLSYSPHKPSRKTTFALMKKGLIIRLNNLSSIKGCIIHFKDIKRVSIHPYTNIQQVLANEQMSDGVSSIGQLIIATSADLDFIFEIPKINLERLVKFFSKKQFEPHFEM